MLRTLTLLTLVAATIAVAQTPGDVPKSDGFIAADGWPASFRREPRPKWGLVVGGGVTLLAGSGVMALMTRRAEYAIPLAGPVIAFVRQAQLSAGPFQALNILYLFAVASQFGAHVAGTLMLVLGLTHTEKATARPKNALADLSFAPGAAGSPLGATLVGRF